MVKKLIFCLILCSLGIGFFFVGKGLYIPVKALIAQVLLEDSWSKIKKGEIDTKPWPWADFQPVACLSFPNHQYRTIVVNSASGTSLAFAPGHLDGSIAPGLKGNCVIIGHRETHFNILQHMNYGDPIHLIDINGRFMEYIVSDICIIDKADKAVINRSAEAKLTLITCYPFSSMFPNNKRFVVVAKSKNDCLSLGIISP